MTELKDGGRPGVHGAAGETSRADGTGRAGETSRAGMLPSEAELRRRYDEFRRRYFDGATPPVEQVRVEWSHRLTSAAGRCYTKQKIIRLSTHYHLKFPEQVNPTLLHEMIHLLVPNHGPGFYEWLARIRARGGTVHRFATERATPKVHRWEYTCTGCGMEALRQRRLTKGGANHRCGRCGGALAERRLA